MISGADPRTTLRGAFRWIAPSAFGQESAIVASPHTPGEQPPSRPPEQTPRVVAVVVTYNRSELLRRTLAGIEGGRLRPAAMVVVDNASTDDTARVLAEWSGPGRRPRGRIGSLRCFVRPPVRTRGTLRPIR